MLAFILAIGTAWSEPVLHGIPVEGVEGLSRPIFQTSSTGWWSQIPRGTVQVFVGNEENEAVLWFESMKEKMAKYRPEPNEAFQSMTGATTAHGDGIGLLIVRNKNLAFMVRHDGEAQSWALTLHEATLPIPDPELAPATLTKEGDLWTVQHPEGAIHLAFKGGLTAKSPQLQFTAPPTKLVVWDKWGRSVVNEVGSLNQGVVGTPVP